MKQQILNWLKTDRSYDKGVALYQQYGKSLSLKAILNRQGETPYNKGLLFEELRKLAEIDQDELRHILSLPVQKEVGEEPVPVKEPATVEEVPETDKKKASPQASEKASGSGRNSPS